MYLFQYWHDGTFMEYLCFNYHIPTNVKQSVKIRHGTWISCSILATTKDVGCTKLMLFSHAGTSNPQAVYTYTFMCVAQEES